MDGGCRCGQVRFSVSEPGLFTSACHCAGCRRMTASAFSLSIGVLAQSFSITKGDPVIGGLHGEHRHFHCGHCKSWMFTRPAGLDHFVNLRSMMLDHHFDFVPFIETYTAEKLSWVTTPATHSFESVPPLEAYEGLIMEFKQFQAQDLSP